MGAQLTAEAIARFCASNGFDLAEGTRMVRSMSVSARSNLAQIYATDELLDDSARMAADSLMVRQALRQLDEGRGAERCPYPDQTDRFYAWHVDIANRDGGRNVCACHGRLNQQH